MLMSDNVANEMEYVVDALVFHVVELVALGLFGKRFVHQYALSLEVVRCLLDACRLF